MLTKIYTHFICFLILIYLNRARNKQPIKATKKSIPKDSKHPKNQYFWEFLYTAQNTVTLYKKNDPSKNTRIKYTINFFFSFANLILIIFA